MIQGDNNGNLFLTGHYRWWVMISRRIAIGSYGSARLSWLMQTQRAQTAPKLIWRTASFQVDRSVCFWMQAVRVERCRDLNVERRCEGRGRTGIQKWSKRASYSRSDLVTHPCLSNILVSGSLCKLTYQCQSNASKLSHGCQPAAHTRAFETN